MAISGMPSGRFTFEGFLSVNKASRTEHIQSIVKEPRTMIFYEAPHKIGATLRDLAAALGDREIAIVREITKIHENVERIKLSEGTKEEEPRGEYVIVVEGGKAEENPLNLLSVEEQINLYIADGLSKMDAVKKVAKERGLKKSDVYKYTI